MNGGETARPASLREERTLLLAALAASLLLSLWCVWRDPIVNNDGVHYFRAAQDLLHGHWRAALSLHNWPFYSFLIAATAALTGLGVEAAAHVVNALLYALLVAGFLAAVGALGGGRRELAIAALLILFLPTVNKYRSYVIRDAGFLAAYLWSLAFLFSYARTRGSTAALGWLAATVAAFLFRLEAAVLLAAVPLLLAYRQAASRSLQGAIVAAGVAFAVLMFVALVVWIQRHDLAASGAQAPGEAGAATLRQALSGYGQMLRHKLGFLRQELLGDLPPRHAYAAYLGAILFVIGFELLRRLSMIYAAVAVYAIARNPFPPGPARFLWLGLMAVNLLIAFEYSVAMGYVVDRYLLALVLTAMLAVPFVFARLLAIWRQAEEPGPARRWGIAALFVACAALGLKSLDVSTDKRYLREAGRWIRDHSPATARVFTDNPILAWYTARGAFNPDNRYDWAMTTEMVQSGEWRRYDYVAVHFGSSAEERRREGWLRAEMDRRPVEVFKNGKGEKILIFQGRQS